VRSILVFQRHGSFQQYSNVRKASLRRPHPRRGEGGGEPPSCEGKKLFSEWVGLARWVLAEPDEVIRRELDERKPPPQPLLLRAIRPLNRTLFVLCCNVSHRLETRCIGAMGAAHRRRREVDDEGAAREDRGDKRLDDVDELHAIQRRC